MTKEFWQMKIEKNFWGKVEIVKNFPRSLNIFAKIGGNLKQEGEMHYQQGMDASAWH